MYIKTNTELKLRTFLRTKGAKIEKDKEIAFNHDLSEADREIDDSVSKAIGYLEKINSKFDLGLSADDIKSFFQGLI